MPKRLYIQTVGCQMNVLDSELITANLLQAGYELVHTTRQAEPFETEIQLPNITCEKCTLQIVEFMAEHGYNRDGGYFYHHCADLQITADPSKPADTRWNAQK